MVRILRRLGFELMPEPAEEPAFTAPSRVGAWMWSAKLI